MAGGFIHLDELESKAGKDEATWSPDCDRVMTDSSSKASLQVS